MSISVDQIKKLRAQTKAGVMEVRQALTESNGDIAKAKDWLRKKGLDKAAKKADRETGDGLVTAYIHAGGQIGALVKLGCETDFVAKTSEFQTLASEIAMQIASMEPKDVKQLLAQSYIRDSKKTIDDLIKEAIAKLGENIQIIEFKRLAI
ncbi:translation elongation factor Ts [Candidatus Beckwithbacteria bacterium]|nr:translation elongation factor Ts [Candidatus Beckwithbacteria bacterium]